MATRQTQHWNVSVAERGRRLHSRRRCALRVAPHDDAPVEDSLDSHLWWFCSSGSLCIAAGSMLCCFQRRLLSECRAAVQFVCCEQLFAHTPFGRVFAVALLYSRVNCGELLWVVMRTALALVCAGQLWCVPIALSLSPSSEERYWERYNLFFFGRGRGALLRFVCEMQVGPAALTATVVRERTPSVHLNYAPRAPQRAEYFW